MKKYCRPLLAGLTLFFAANPLAAQPPQLVIDTSTGWKPDTVSVEEMARHFQEWADDIPYRPEATLDRLLTNKMPAFLVYEADADAGRDAFFLDSPKLEELASGGAGPGLPPSYWRPLRDEQDTRKVCLQ